MSLTVLAPQANVVSARHGRSVAARWTPPLDADGLMRLLEAVRAWTPLDVEAIFTDLDMAIGYIVEAGTSEVTAAPEAPTVELVDRLCGHLIRLSDIAVADQKDPPTKVMVALIERGRTVREEPAPDCQRTAVARARSLAFLLSDLAELLIEAQIIGDGA
ncbi:MULTISPECIES: DUF6415 family natural product biosynthesis protein [unclassified Streptomyces]|uniref:DUF6415 family natural product biosynthesis protein n=1 Tax=unclassified Streptomyces TaxID=2593676 RepID=UPI002E13CFDC|nr:DUF6415 family natural product biosynthesis protein [Streptomyces sp. NBC_01197]WSS49046.1 DUF6415 family natural product biosynthesis protein [Streptomyces sp. NBC_01180]